MNQPADPSKTAGATGNGPFIPEGYDHIVVTGDSVKPAAESPLMDAVSEAIRYTRQNPDRTIEFSIARPQHSTYGTPMIRQVTVNLTELLAHNPDLQYIGVLSALSSGSGKTHQR